MWTLAYVDLQTGRTQQCGVFADKQKAMAYVNFNFGKIDADSGYLLQKWDNMAQPAMAQAIAG